MGKGYNGHKNRNHWNVALWIGNDEGLYRLAKEIIRCADNRKHAAESMLRALKADGITATPDGVPYTVTTIRAAMRGL